MPYVDDNLFPKLIFAEGSAPSSPASGDQSLFIDNADHKLKRVNSSGTVTSIESAGGSAGTSVLLAYDQATDINGVAVSASTWTDVIANQTFTVSSSTSVVEIAVRGNIQMIAAATTNVALRLVIDSGGTVQNIMLGSTDSGATGNALSGGGSVFLSGLAAVSHTVKIQVYSDSQTANAYCRVSTHPNTEFLHISVIEHKN